MSGSSGSSTTTVKRLPDYAEPYANDYLVRAAGLSQTLYTTYTGATIAPQPQDEIDALVAMAARGRNGDPVMNEAVLLMELILNGQFLLGTRQAFIDMWSSVQGPLATELNTLKGLLSGASAYYVGAPIVEDRFGDELAIYAVTVMDRMEKRLYRENYKAERDLQSVAASMATSIGKHGVTDAELLRASGLYQREYDQSVLHDLYKKWMELEEADIRRLDLLGNAIRSLVGTQSSITEPYYRASKAVAFLGGAMSGAATGAMITGAKMGSAGGWGGVAVGALVGGIIGLASSK